MASESFFNKKSFKFLSDLEINNNKDWFVENKPSYQKNVLNPLKDLISDMEIFINILDSTLETKPVTNKAISTIYRDTRYSKTKLPLKTYIGFNFKRKRPDWKYFPAFIFRINTNGYVFGMSIMKNSPDSFYKFRQDVDANKTFQKIVSKIKPQDGFELLGGDYKKFIYGGKSAKLKEWYCKKNLFIKCNRSKEHYSSRREMIIDLQENFEKLTPLFNYFNQVFDSE